MPPAIAPLIGAVAVGAGAAAAGITVFGLSVGASAILLGVGSAALGFVQGALAPKPKLPNLTGFEVAASNRTVMIRQPITARRLPFGEVIMSGVLTFYESTGDNQYHHMIVTLGDAPQAEWDSIGIVWLDDTPIFPTDIDGSGNVTSGKFNGKVRIKKHLGGPDQVADADLLSAVTRLDSNFRGRGVAYIYLRVDWDNDIFPNGLPSLRAMCRTNKVIDTRISESPDVYRYSNNAALCLNAYLTEADVGLGYATTDINTTVLNAAANTADEIVDVKLVSAMVVGVDTTNDLLELATVGSGAPIRFETGDRVEIESDDTLPGGLSAETAYYAVVERLVGTSFEEEVDVRPSSIPSLGKGEAAINALIASGQLDTKKSVTTVTNPAIGLATSFANAMAGTLIDITSAGAGSIGVVKTGEPRYRCTGIVDTDRTPQDNILDLLSAMAGRLVWTGGEFHVLPSPYGNAAPLDFNKIPAPAVVRERRA